ncbi:GAF domain-containing protein [Saccharopolyspora sp. NPDC003752]
MVKTMSIRGLGASPDDPEKAAGEEAARQHRLRALGITAQPDREFDEIAQGLARALGTPHAMVNVFLDQTQVFIGLHTPSMQHSLVLHDTARMSRIMSRDKGFCPLTVRRRVPLAIKNVFGVPLFASNDVVDRFQVQTYLGAPLIDHTGTALGTTCVVGNEPRDWQQSHVELIKSTARDVLDLMYQRRQR